MSGERTWLAFPSGGGVNMRSATFISCPKGAKESITIDIQTPTGASTITVYSDADKQALQDWLDAHAWRPTLEVIK